MKFKVLGTPLPYETLDSVRARMSEVSPTLTSYGHKEHANFFQQNVKLAQVGLINVNLFD